MQLFGKKKHLAVINATAPSIFSVIEEFSSTGTDLGVFASTNMNVPAGSGLSWTVGFVFLAVSDSSLLKHTARRILAKGEMPIPELEASMNQVQVEQKSYEMPPREGISIAHFLTVADVERSARYYEKVFGARILTMGDGNAPPYLQLANIWMILNVGGGPTPDKPTVTLSVPDPNHINSFMNFRVADIQACYELWKSRGAEFITEPIAKYGEIRCYIRDPDGYIIEVGQSKPGFTYG
jgi:catechol 2,3-dioxygenase-like lactoylglutathione lyase family enzyme